MPPLLDYAIHVTEALSDAAMHTVFGRDVRERPVLAPTPRDVVMRDGAAQVYRFRRPAGAPEAPRDPLLVIPSMINKWYVLDLRARSSFIEALVNAGIETYCLDWGTARDEDRYVTWDDVIDRIARVARFVRRSAGVERLGVLGYCMGATLSGIYTALEPERVAALVNLAGPFDFSKAGVLGHMVQPGWFDAAAIAEAGNVAPIQMQQGFQAMRPTLNFSKLIGYLDRMKDRSARDSFYAIETWGNDNIPFPAAAYATYIRELYQENALVKKQHRVKGRLVDLGRITCPVLTIGADRDTICPKAAALGLNHHCGSKDVSELHVPGGHVGAVVGSRAAHDLYPATAKWLRERLT